MNSEIRRQLNKTFPTCLTMLCILALPISLKFIGLPSRERLYSGLPAFRGVTAGIEHEIFTAEQDADIVLVGSSTTYASLRPELVSYYFAHKSKRKLKIVSLAILGAGPDVNYFVLQDYLQRHKTKVVVLGLPWRSGLRNGPDEGLADFWRYGEYTDLMSGLSFRDRLSIYSEFVLKSPRQLLNRIRPNPIESGKGAEDNLRELLNSKYGPATVEGFERHWVRNRKLDLLNTEDTNLTFQPEATKSNYFALWYHNLQQLIARSGAKLLLINYPEPKDDPQTIAINLPKSVFKIGQPIIGIRPDSLFSIAKGEKTDSYFSGLRHIKGNGAELFCSRALPAIEAYFEQSVGGSR